MANQNQDFPWSDSFIKTWLGKNKEEEKESIKYISKGSRVLTIEAKINNIEDDYMGKGADKEGEERTSQEIQRSASRQSTTDSNGTSMGQDAATSTSSIVLSIT